MTILSSVARRLFHRPIESYRVTVAKLSTPTLRTMYRAHVKAYGVTSPQARYLRDALSTRAENDARHGIVNLEASR